MSDKIIIKERLYVVIAPVFFIALCWGFVILVSLVIYESIVNADTYTIANLIFFSPIWLGILYLLIKHVGYFFNLLTFFVKNPYIQIDDDGIIINHHEVDTKPTLITWSNIKAVFATKDFDDYHTLYVLYDKESSKRKNTNEYQKLLIHTKAIVYDDEIYKKDDLFDCLCQLADEINIIKREKCPPHESSATVSHHTTKRGRFDGREWRLVEPIFFPILSLVVSLICFYLGITFPLSKLSSQGVSLASIAPNLFFASIMILMGLICVNIFLKNVSSPSKIKLDNQGIKIYQHNKSKQMLFISWEQVYQAKSEYGRHCYYVCIETLVYLDDDIVVTIKIRVDSLFPILSPDYEEKAVDIVNAINNSVYPPKGRQDNKSLLRRSVDVGSYGQYSFLDVVPYE